MRRQVMVTSIKDKITDLGMLAQARKYYVEPPLPHENQNKLIKLMHSKKKNPVDPLQESDEP